MSTGPTFATFIEAHWLPLMFIIFFMLPVISEIVKEWYQVIKEEHHRKHANPYVWRRRVYQ